MSGPWKTDQWFVSPWNYEPEVRENLHFPQNIRIHDVSLRDGEQQSGLVFRRDEKVAIARALAEAGVHRIEAGMPAVSDEDEAAIKEIVQLDLPSQIFSFARCMPADVELAKKCGVAGIITEVPSSEHIIRKAYGKTMDWAIKSSIEATRAAKEAGLYTVFFTIDSTRSDIHELLDMLERVATEGHMDALTLADSFGGCTPEGVAHVIRKVKQRFTQPVEIHCHEDFGLGVANTLAALANGAEVAHVTVSAIGERAGNVPLEDTVLSLKVLYGVDTGIKTERFYELSKLVQQIAGITLPPNRPIIGDSLYDVESGIVSMFHRRCKDDAPTEYAPFLPKLVGRPEIRITYGKGSGLANIEEFLDLQGLSANDEQKQEIVDRVKQAGMEKKSTLEESAVRQIVDTVLAG